MKRDLLFLVVSFVVFARVAAELDGNVLQIWTKIAEIEFNGFASIAVLFSYVCILVVEVLNFASGGWLLGHLDGRCANATRA